MRIALLTDGIYPYVIGGMQKHSYFLIKFFTQNNVFVDLYHTNNSSLDIHLLDCFTEQEKKHINNYVFEFPKHSKIPGHYIQESYEYSCLLYNEFLKHEAPDFIYVKGYVGWKFMEEKKKGKKIPPIAVRLHGYEIFQPTQSLKVKVWNILYRKMFLYNNNNADYVYSYGGKITDLILKNTSLQKNRIISIPTGIENKWINPTPQVPTEKVKFIFVGRYDIRKGIKELNKALLSIKQTTNFEFIFIGPIPDKFKLKQNNIIYLGKLNDAEEIKKKIQECDVLVLPSHSEGMPNVVMEGMASGCAIIATDVGAVNLMVDSQNGWLIQPFDSHAIASSIIKAIELNKSELFELKKASIQKVNSHFLWEQIIHSEIAAIEDVIKKEYESN